VIGAFCNSLSTSQPALLTVCLSTFRGIFGHMMVIYLGRWDFFYTIIDVLDLLNITQIDFVVVDALRP
jgi:hypothetical protein